MQSKIRGLRIMGLDSVEPMTHDGPLEKDGYYRRLQDKRARERKIAREKHDDWLHEHGFEPSGDE